MVGSGLLRPTRQVGWCVDIDVAAGQRDGDNVGVPGQKRAGAAIAFQAA
jgi:hypothetical protein